MPTLSNELDFEKMKRIKVDPRVIEKIQRSGHLLAEQGSGFMQPWGGPSRYRQMAKLPKEERITYAAILGGTTTEDQIALVTGLSPAEITKGIAGLQAKKLIAVEKVV